MISQSRDPAQTSMFVAEDPVIQTYFVKMIHADGPIADVSLFMTRTRFGWTSFAENPLGLCAMAFADDRIDAASHILKRFPLMKTIGEPGINTLKALAILENPLQPIEISVVVKGTVFQEKVWQLLLDYTLGRQTTYGDLSQRLNMRKGARAVGTAVGANVIAFLIPCHRVLNAGGVSGHFRWGAQLKKDLLAWEKSLFLSSAC